VASGEGCALAIRRTSQRHLGVLLAVCSVLAALLCVPALAAATSAVAATQPTSYQAPGTPSPSVAGATTPFTTYQAPRPHSAAAPAWCR
jgi:ABC-type phosphate transport system substrate-binding protein